MPPRSDFVPKSSLGIVPPATRAHGYALTVDVWLQERRDTDGAEGLWRIHDGIYDLEEFVATHPGGSDWLTITKGTDITEAFEVHHLTSLPDELLRKYFVRNARSKRNFPYTFKEDGFYRTLKKEISESLKAIPKQPLNTSNFLIDAMLVLMFLFSILSVRYWSYWLGVLAGLFLGLVTVAAHNYLHRKDNFRMYYFQFSLMQVREFRVVHALSHHLLTNTVNDLEISLFEPILEYLPIYKSPLKRYLQWFIMAPVTWITFFHGALIRRLIDAYHFKAENLKITDLNVVLLPAAMYLFGAQSLCATLLMWNFIICVASCHFTFVALHAAHHHPDIFHDGDTPREGDLDWGISQLDTLMERKETTGSHFMVLTNFGDHCLHHMFPTLDHGALEHLYPVFNGVLEKFGVNLRMISQWGAITGGFQQLVRVDPNPNPPNFNKQ